MNKKGQALILVVAVMAMMFVVITAFFVLAQAERTAALRHLDSLRAQYIAEAGVAYAKEIIKLDKQANLIDALTDLTFLHFQGEDADLDGDGQNESKGFNLVNKEDGPFGRFYVRVSDEASRFNLNSGSQDNLEKLFSNIGVDASKAGAIVSRRPFNAKEEIGPILGTGDYTAAKDFLTIYSRDPEINLNKERRAYLNTSQPRIILETFLNAGIKDSFWKAANLKDASDTDLSQTLFDKFSQTFAPSSLLEAGGWKNKGGFYEADGTDDTPGKFSWSNLALEDGEYFCFLYGISSKDVVGGEPPMLSGEGLQDKVEVSGGSLTISLKPAKGKTSRFSYIELASLTPKEGLTRKTVTGTEALVINELMAKPAKEILAEAGSYLDPGQIRTWTFTGINPGSYYVVVEALKEGGLVGDVHILGDAGSGLLDQDYFPKTVNVASNGTITVEIRNNSLQQSSFKGIKILQEPDGEFVELLNVSPAAINLGNFSVEAYTSAGELVPGWPGRIPEGTKIEPYQHLVLAIDANDVSPSPEDLRKNKISFQAIHQVNAVSLVFDETGETINKKSDLMPDSGGRVILKDAQGQRIDAVEYENPQLKSFISLERPDPSTKGDTDGDGFFDGWYSSESKDLSTPAAANENSGMYTWDEEKNKLIKNNVTQINVFNAPLADLSEVEKLSSGENWKRFSVEDVARMADNFAYEATILDMDGHQKEGGADTTGIWEFSGITPGDYLLNVLSFDAESEGEEIQVGIRTNTSEEFKEMRTLIFVLKTAFYGAMEIPQDSSILQIKIIADTKKVKSGLKQVQLEPIVFTPGRINVNTAKREVLRSLFGTDGLVDTVVNNRPIGISDTRRLGVGELFLQDAALINFSNSLTVKSDIYEILSRGDFLPHEKTLAYQTVRTVIERAE